MSRKQPARRGSRARPPREPRRRERGQLAGGEAGRRARSQPRHPGGSGDFPAAGTGRPAADESGAEPGVADAAASARLPVASPNAAASPATAPSSSSAPAATAEPLSPSVPPEGSPFPPMV